MKFLTIDYIKQHSRIDFDDEVASLELYASAAEETVLNLCRRTVENFIEEYGGIPDPIRQAALLITDLSYQQRSAASAQQFSAVPYGNVDVLLKPYMRLADSPASSRHHLQTVTLGSDLKIAFNAELPDDLTLQDVPFTIIAYNEMDERRRMEIEKADCLLTDEGEYVAMVDTDTLGVGLVMLRLTARVPDTDYADGYRREVVKINPYIRIKG